MSAAKRLHEKVLLYKVRTHKDPQAFGQLYDLYIEKIYRFVYFKVGTKEEAEDVTSEIFLKAWNYLVDEKRKPVQHFSGFVYTIARTSIIDFYRKKAKQQECSVDDLILEDQVAYNHDYIGSISNKQDVTRLIKTIRKMKQSYQEVLTLRYLDELSIAEISQIVQKTKTNTRVLLHRATKLLQELSDSSSYEENQ